MMERAIRHGLAASCLALTLAGCVEDLPEARQDFVRSSELVRREGVSPQAATVAFASLDGPPAPLAARFAADLGAKAADRDIVVVDPKLARYVVRGYLDANPVKDGVSVAYVWDIYDADKRRAQRMSDGMIAKAKTGSGDAWDRIDDAALESLATKSADDLVAFLTNTPEALAAAKPQNSGRRPAAAIAARAQNPLAYAEAE